MENYYFTQTPKLTNTDTFNSYVGMLLTFFKIDVCEIFPMKLSKTFTSPSD